MTKSANSAASEDLGIDRLSMSSESIYLSRLIRSCSTEPIDVTRSPSDVAQLDLTDICSLRQRSIRKFARALDDIAIRYEGDGDEEADDVIDLENLEVIEDRGYIINRFSSRSESSQASSSSRDKGKRRATKDLDFLGILSPLLVSNDGDDEWVDEDDYDRGSGDDDPDTDDAHHDNDRKTQQARSDINNDPFLISSSSPSSRKSPSQGTSPQRRKLARLYLNHLDSSTPTSSSTPSSRGRVGTQGYQGGDDTVTNELFERLKKRIMERSSDIIKYRLSKPSMICRCDDQRISMSSSPSSSLKTSVSLSSALKPTKHILSPYLQRLLHPDNTNHGVVRPQCSLEPRKISVMIPPFTPTTVRKKRRIENSSTGPTLNDGTDALARNKWTKESSSKSSTFLSSPTHQATVSSGPSFGSSRPSYPSSSCDEDPTILFTSDQLQPTFLFQSHLKLVDSNGQRSTPTARRSKRMKPGHDQNHQNAKESSQPLKPVDDQFSRESSEDPLYLPPSSKKTRT